MCSVSGHTLLNKRKEHFNIVNYNIKMLNGIIIYNTRLAIFFNQNFNAKFCKISYTHKQV